MWVWGKDSIEFFMEYAPQISLVGAVPNINVPFLITHGANDRQIPLAYAHQCYDEAVNSPLRARRFSLNARVGWSMSVPTTWSRYEAILPTG